MMVARTPKETYWKRYSYRMSAVAILNRQVKQGNIIPPKQCFLCNTDNKPIIAHHNNYAYPLEVDWICYKCHGKVHKYLRSIDWVDYVERPLDKKRLPNMIQPKDLEYIDNETKIALDKLLSSVNFTNREKEIIRLRAIGNTLQEIGYVFTLNGERIRQILCSFWRMFSLRFHSFQCFAII